MESMDTSISVDSGIRYEVVARPESMVSGTLGAGGYTISATSHQVQFGSTYLQVNSPSEGYRTPPPITRVNSGVDEASSGVFTLSEFLAQLEDYNSSIPDTVANHYLHLGGFESADPRMGRLLSITTQKFISDVIHEAFTHCKLKGSAPVGKGNKKQEKKVILTMEDLVPILNDYGISVKKPMCYT